jgi:hypothetical protein
MDAGVAAILTAVPMVGSNPAGTVPWRRGDEVPAPGARPPDPFSRGDLTWQRAALLESRAERADRRGLDLLFADLGRTDDPFPDDSWL